jgi:hypothetical protein
VASLLVGSLTGTESTATSGAPRTMVATNVVCITRP